MGNFIYFAGAMGTYIALKESGEKMKWWELLWLTICWPMWLIGEHVEQLVKRDMRGTTE